MSAIMTALVTLYVCALVFVLGAWLVDVTLTSVALAIHGARKRRARERGR